MVNYAMAAAAAAILSLGGHDIEISEHRSPA